MNTVMKIASAGAISLFALAGHAFADDKETVKALYDVLSNAGSAEAAEAFMDATTEDWQSIGDYSGKFSTRESFMERLKRINMRVPDLKWHMEEVYQDGNHVIVRGRGTGTPNGPMFGVDGEGRSFEVLSIDIHEMQDGKMVRSYHVEDWAGVMEQLRGKE